ncbi:potassium transporter TrkA [Nitrincola sp. A-D6]|uniref:potassium channel family protein n=1 Tax=Nitrincola sp. A-D6 TaxID=1545442 RepID=UPI00051F9541|nr:potassium channel protein [Nitrincola sp. A-D6]KGK42541.1 potassium transporter TrkA [Nitrincola sp. A-D6]
MQNILYLLLRRLRTPLIMLIVVYAITIAGFVLIPGQDDQGEPWRMGFFHAFYFLSYMATTIGFGEIPFAFTNAQRMWAMVSIYLSVSAWLYAIGATLQVFQEASFLRLIRLRRFIKSVNALDEPFWLICGYGVTGSLIVRELAAQQIRSVVLDVDQARVDSLELENALVPIPVFCADASRPDNLEYAGIRHPCCQGVMALTNNDNANLSIAIASKLQYPKRQVFSRTQSAQHAANLASFGTDLIVDPFKVYAEYLALAVSSPKKHLVFDWLTNPQHRALSSLYKIRQGRWIICGYGRYGQALYKALVQVGVDITVIEPDIQGRHTPDDSVEGTGTEAGTLRQARVETAVGIVAGTANDADNLSIIMTARELNPKLTCVVRQNRHSNERVFQHANCDFVMKSGAVIASRIMAYSRSSLLLVFIEHLLQQSDVWAHTLLNRLNHHVGDERLETWEVVINEDKTPAVCSFIAVEGSLQLKYLMKNPHDRQVMLDCFPLLLQQGDDLDYLPGELQVLQPGDRVLFCGRAEASREMEWNLNNYNMLHYSVTGDDAGHTVLARILRKFI